MNGLKGKWLSKLYLYLLFVLLLPFVAQNAASKVRYAVEPFDNFVSESVFYFVVSMTDGTEISIPFTEYPTLTPQDKVLLLTTTKIQMELSNDNVKDFTIIKQEGSTGIQDILPQGHIERKGNSLFFTNCQVGSDVFVFDNSGRVVISTKINKEGKGNIVLQGIPCGTYIIKSESVTCKVVKK